MKYGKAETWQEHKKICFSNRWQLPEMVPALQRLAVANHLEARNCWPRVLKKEMTHDRFWERVKRMDRFLTAKRMYESTERTIVQRH